RHGGSGMKLRMLFAKTALAALGWKLTGQAPQARSYVVLGAPHTTNWDFFFIFLTSWGFGTRFCWVGKEELFRAPLGGFFRALGGVGVKRSGTNNTVDSLVRRFAD